MTLKQITTKLREGVLWVVLGAIFTIVPFYYNTNSTLANANNRIDIVTLKTESNEIAVKSLEGSQLVQEERFRNIEQRLERIEKKLDYLIENNR